VPVERLAEVVVRLFKPPMFKRLWVDDRRTGIQFISGNDAYKIRPDEPRYVRVTTPNCSDFILEKGWVVFQAAGQIYGLFGRPLLVYGWLENTFCADDMYRIVPTSIEDGAYLFGFFRTSVGRVLIKRQAAGYSIPRVWDPQMTQVRVPWPDRKARERLADPLLSAHMALASALEKEDEAAEVLAERMQAP
jgi:type I restriction enzyme S subunit